MEKGHTALAQRLAELEEEFGKQEKLAYATVEVRPPPDCACSALVWASVPLAVARRSLVSSAC